MRASNHLNENELRLLLESAEVDCAHSDAEAHLSDCFDCRTRLELLAMNGEWFDEYRGLLSTTCTNGLLALTSAGDGPNATSREPKNHKHFEQIALNGMLRDLLPQPSHPELLSRIGHYDVERIIGFGGMGVVVKAWDTELRRPVAIKLLMPRLLHDGTAKQRFAREARAAAAILHPNVIGIHGINETNDLPWFVMPLINGPTLQELVAEAGPLKESEIARIGVQIASGLAAAHSHGVIHRDIKPANILVDNHVNRVVITDFGLARRDFEHSMTGTGSVAGTLEYMSPEQTRNEVLDARSDLFNVGALLYFLASGATPFRSESPAGVIHRIVNDAHADVRTHNPEISESLSSTIDCLLSKSPADRFDSAAELEGHFSQLIAHLNRPTQHAAPLIRRKQKRVKQTRWLAGGLFAVALLFVVAVCVMQAFGPEQPEMPDSAATAARTAQEVRGDIEERFGITSEVEFALDVDRLRREIRAADLDTLSLQPEDASLLDELGKLEDEFRHLLPDTDLEQKR